MLISTKASWESPFLWICLFSFLHCLRFFYFWVFIFSCKCLGVFSLVFSCLTASHSCACCFFFPFCFFIVSMCIWMLWGVGRTTSQQVEGCLLLQNSMAFWEWDKAPPPPLKPPKKSFSACCLVCGGLSLYDRLKNS